MPEENSGKSKANLRFERSPEQVATDLQRVRELQEKYKAHPNFAPWADEDQGSYPGNGRIIARSRQRRIEHQ